MDLHALEAKKVIVSRFVAAFNDGDLATIDALLAPDFVWHTAVTREGEREAAPFQSTELAGRPSPTGEPFKDKAATLTIFGHIFATGARDTRDHFGLRIVSVTAEDDRVAFEMEGEARNPSNGREYRNIYFVLARIRDGQFVLYKEYQDTLHVFDVWAAS